MANKNSGGRVISKEDESMMRTYLVEEGGIGMNTAASLSGNDLKKAYEATRERVISGGRAISDEDARGGRAMSDEDLEGRAMSDEDRYGRKDGGYIKNYARGGGVRKAKFMDD